MLSNRKLPFDRMCGGCASHFGINPGYFRGETPEDRGLEFKQKIFNPDGREAVDRRHVPAVEVGRDRCGR